MNVTRCGSRIASASFFVLAAAVAAAADGTPPGSAAQSPQTPIPCVVRWHYASTLAPDWCSTPSPAPSTSPQPGYAIRLVVEGSFPQLIQSPSMRLIGATSQGLRFEFETDPVPASAQPAPSSSPAGPAFHGLRKLDGVPFGRGEDRIALTFALAGAAARSFTVSANPRYHCVVEGDGLSDEQLAACSAALPSTTPAPSLSPSPSPAAGPSAAPSPAPRCGQDKPDFCGSLTVGMPLLRERLGIGRIPAGRSLPTQILSICARLTREAAPSAQPSPPGASADPSCTSFALVHQNAAGDQTYSLALGPTNRKSNAGESAAGSAAPVPATALRRFTRSSASAAGTAPSNAQAGPDDGTFGLGGALAQPLDSALRFSLEVQNVDLPSSVIKQTKMLLAQAPQLGLNGLANGIALNGDGKSIRVASPDPSASPFGENGFTTVDMAPFQRVVAHPYRPRLDQEPVAKQVDLAPFDPGTLKQFTLGQKLVWQTPDSFAGAGYFDDFATHVWGTIAHAEHDTRHFSFGVSRIEASRAAPAPSTSPDNAYVTRPFSVDTVAGMGYRFGDPRWQTFLRYGTAGSGRDQLAAVSYAERSPGRLVGGTEDVTQARFLAGYRSLDAHYDPLGTGYSQFAGTQSIFTALGVHRIHPQDDGDPYEYDLALDAARAHDYRAPRYSLFELKTSIPLGVDKKPNFSLSLDWTRSSIAPSVVTRQSGSFVWHDPPSGSALLDNDTTSFALGYTNSRSHLTASLGESFTHTPSCAPGTGAAAVPSCTSDYVPKPQAALSFAVNRLIFNGSSAAKAFQSTSAANDKSPAANRLVANAVLAWHLVCGGQGQPFDVEPYATYNNNVSETTTTFTTGTLYELGIQFGVLSKNGALSFGYKVARDASGQPIPVQGHALSYGFVYGNNVLWKQLSALDNCAQKTKTTPSPKAST